MGGPPARTIGFIPLRERRTVILRATPRLALLALGAAFAAVFVLGCGREGSDESDGPSATSGAQLSGRIQVDGSSTVGPLVQTAAQRFRQEQPDVDVTVGISGTGGGFERFCAGETDISDASRPINEDEEAPVCKKNGVGYTEIQVATDALTVVVNSENDWVDCLTVDQLKKMWEPKAEGNVTSWADIDPSFPDEELLLAGPGTDSGTFDYFTDEIVGEEGASRSDYQPSENDNVTVQAVTGERGGLGYFGFSYYEQNQETLKAVAVDSGNGCVEPSIQTAQSGDYRPLSRPLFIYVKNEAMQRPEVAGFVDYIVGNAQTIAEEALFVPLNEEQLADSKAKVEQATRA
jgi:phosphate transport system substrate-binding protein